MLKFLLRMWKAALFHVFQLQEQNSTKKKTETVYKWHSFLRNIKKGKLKCYVYPFSEATLSGTCGAELKVPALSDVLQFGSGSWFSNFSGKLKFDHDTTLTAKRICANTCSLTITITVNKRYASIVVMVMNLPLISCRTFLRLMGLGYHEHDNEDVTGCSLISYFR